MDQNQMVLRQVPVRTPHRCETCTDLGVVYRIIGGTKWREACPNGCPDRSWS